LKNKLERKEATDGGQRRWALPTASSPPAIWSCSQAIDDGRAEEDPEIAEL